MDIHTWSLDSSSVRGLELKLYAEARTRKYLVNAFVHHIGTFITYRVPLFARTSGYIVNHVDGDEVIQSGDCIYTHIEV